jgi:hypothetical protein
VQNQRDRAAAQYLVDRISAVAVELGLQPGEPGCEPNINIVFTTNGKEMAASLVESSPLVFRPFGGTGGTTQGLHALAQFKASEAAVRWWQITLPVNRGGEVAVQLPNSWTNLNVFSGTDKDGNPMEGPHWMRQVPWTAGSNSRITHSMKDQFLVNYIIADASKLQTASWEQVADYLAMVALAQIKPDAQPTSYSSILNLFNTSNPPQAMTAMDRLYLQSLYEMDTMRMPKLQRSLFSDTMARKVSSVAD